MQSEIENGVQHAVEKSPSLLPDNFSVEIRKISGWELAKECALSTCGLESAKTLPTETWKSRLCRCEHSPLREVRFIVKLHNVPSFVSVHFVRHKYGAEHFVQSQRSDRSKSGASRHDLPQDAPVLHTMDLNAAEIIFISRRRLCSQASAETRAVWRAVVDELSKTEPELAAACVPECVYRGFCPEFRPCGRANSKAFEDELMEHRTGFLK